MKNPDSHIYLYAKGHYKRTNTINDLKIIIGERSGIKPKFINIGMIECVLLNIVHDKCINDSKSKFLKFVKGLRPNSIYYRMLNKEYNFEEALIDACLSEISIIQVKNWNKVLIELDEPDDKILPLTKIKKTQKKK